MSIPRLAAITDEFSSDLDTALTVMEQLGFSEAELRLVDGRNIVTFSDAEVAQVRDAVERRGMRVVSIASPVLKYMLPGGPTVDQRVQQDVFGSSYTWDDHERITTRAFEVAQAAGARIVRVFSFWRTVEPRSCFQAVVEALRPMADDAASRGLVIGLENEHACNVGTATEAAEILAMLQHPALGLIWDPANMAVLEESPFPEGYAQLPVERVVHVHVKDCTVDNFVPTWQPVGSNIAWRDQVAALVRDGYKGSFSLETHWRGSDRLEASRICGETLRDMVIDASRQTSKRTGAPVLQDR